MSDSVRPYGQQPTRLLCPQESPGKNTGVGCHFLLQCMRVKSESEVAQPCPTLCDPVDCSLPSSSIMGFSRQESWSRVPSPFPERELSRLQLGNGQKVKPGSTQHPGEEVVGRRHNWASRRPPLEPSQCAGDGKAESDQSVTAVPAIPHSGKQPDHTAAFTTQRGLQGPWERQAMEKTLSCWNN